jgi:hypothetical protein
VSKTSGVSSNEGVIADTVTANALAVGKNATAQSFSSVDIAQFRSSVAELKQTIERLELPARAKATISENVSGLEAEAAKAAPDRSRVEGSLKSLSSTTKLLGEFVSNATIILGPVAKIAALFGLTIL